MGHSLASHEQDIQLNGLGIEAEHCVIEIEISEVYLVPIDGARLVYLYLLMHRNVCVKYIFLHLIMDLYIMAFISLKFQQ